MKTAPRLLQNVKGSIPPADFYRAELPIRRGVYHLLTSDRRKLNTWLRLRKENLASLIGAA